MRLDGFDCNVFTHCFHPPEEANFSLKMTVPGELRCVALPFCCVVVVALLSQHLLD